MSTFFQIPRWPRLILISIAITMIAVAVALWIDDGAWRYGAMPTKGVIRTALFGGFGCLCLLISGGLARLR